MNTREAVKGDVLKLLDIITTYKVLKLEQLIAVIKDKKDNVRRTVIKLLEQTDRIFVKNDLVSSEENWAKNYDRGIILAFWVLLDFQSEWIFHTTSVFPAKIEFITENGFFDIIVAEKGQENLLNVFFNKHSDKSVQHFVVVESEAQMNKIEFPGIKCFCIVNEYGKVDYYK